MVNPQKSLETHSIALAGHLERRLYCQGRVLFTRPFRYNNFCHVEVFWDIFWINRP